MSRATSRSVSVTFGRRFPGLLLWAARDIQSPGLVRLASHLSDTDRCETVPHKRRGPLRPDFNPIENMWKELNSRLAETAPVHLEKLPEFQVRVKNVVNWLNRNKEDMMRNCVS